MTDPQRASSPQRSFQAPKGTRDFYPPDMLRRRYITDAWRRVSLRHGFEEIDGPTFEHLDLYTVKSGEGIVSELFSFQRTGGDDRYALRPEFTPTLARMYAARAKQLPQPTKWFCIPNFFRAERPQRGRLREFFQWNVDFIGNTKYDEDADTYGWSGFDLPEAEALAVLTSCLGDFGLRPADASIRCNDRRFISSVLQGLGLKNEMEIRALELLDRISKVQQSEFISSAAQLGIEEAAARDLHHMLTFEPEVARTQTKADLEQYTNFLNETIRRIHKSDSDRAPNPLAPFLAFAHVMTWSAGGHHFGQWLMFDPRIVRGLAYYTHTVFEVIAEGERAVAGGGRYDNLIELFGGPPTPACGFGMGDVVLGNLLEDRDLIPEGRDLLEALSKPMPIRPDVFVISSGKEGADERVTPLVAQLRRGVESECYTQSQASDDAAKRMKPWDGARYDVAPRHARRSYKATKNVGKLLGDAGACHARFAVILESAEKCMLKNLDSGEQREVGIEDVGREVGKH